MNLCHLHAFISLDAELIRSAGGGDLAMADESARRFVQVDNAFHYSVFGSGVAGGFV